jgi:hypothetical protein
VDRLARFLRFRLNKFSSATEPIVADDWLRLVNKDLVTCECTDAKKVQFTAHLLEGPTAMWWETYQITHPIDGLDHSSKMEEMDITMETMVTKMEEMDITIVITMETMVSTVTTQKLRRISRISHASSARRMDTIPQAVQRISLMNLPSPIHSRRDM